VAEVGRFIGELRKTRYDWVIDFQNLLKSSIWVLLSRADRKVGFGRGMEHSEGSYLFLNHRIPPVDMNIHALQRELLLLEKLGIPKGPVQYDLPIPPESEQQAVTLLGEAGWVMDRELVLINPVAKWPTKLWENDRFAAVADRLIAYGFQVAFTGSSEDRPTVDDICNDMKREAVRLEGKTSLKILAAIIRRAGVLVTTDTGPMHIAAAAGTPVVALFGATAPWRTGPYGDCHIVLRTNLSCSPCLKKTCRTTAYEQRACLLRLTVDQVVDAVLGKMSAGNGCGRE